MKLLLAVIFAFTSSAFAYDVPKDAVIKVFDKSGKQIGEMSRSEYKVVKLGTSKVKVVEKVITRTVTVPRSDVKQNRISVMGGVGYDGMTVKSNGQFHEVTETREAVFGLGYHRKLTDKDSDKLIDRLSIGGTYINNDTATLDVGVDF